MRVEKKQLALYDSLAKSRRMADRARPAKPLKQRVQPSAIPCDQD